MLKIEICSNFNTEAESIWHYCQTESGFTCSSIRMNTNGDWCAFDYEDISNAEMLEILYNTTTDDMVVELTEDVLMGYSNI